MNKTEYLKREITKSIFNPTEPKLINQIENILRKETKNNFLDSRLIYEFLFSSSFNFKYVGGLSEQIYENVHQDISIDVSENDNERKLNQIVNNLCRRAKISINESEIFIKENLINLELNFFADC